MLICAVFSYYADAVSGNAAYVPDVAEEGHDILFTNQKNVFPDTGVRLDTLPYSAMLGAVIAALVGLLLRRKRDVR